ncbi:unnamed protein product [Colias eurytheme]|nr:unnamed protein product [Colias eurytheme]
MHRGWHGAARAAAGTGAVRQAGAMHRRAALLLTLLVLAASGRRLRVLKDDAAAFYVGIAAPPSAASAVRAFNRTLADVAQTYLAGDFPLHLRNISLLPLYIELPEDERLVFGL